MPSKNIDRRQLLKSTVAGAAAIGGGMVAAKTAGGCPVFFGPDGTRVVYFCIDNVLLKTPLAWKYRYTSCQSEDTVEVWDVPNLKDGDCANAQNDSSCATSSELAGGWDVLRANGAKEFISKRLSSDAREQIRASL